MTKEKQVATSRAMSVMVNIGARVASSVGSSATAVERRMGAMGKALKVQAAESKIYAREMTASYRNMASLFIGGGAYAGLHKMVNASNEYAHQISMLAVAGRSSAEVAQAIAAAHKTMLDVPTATLTDNLKLINETTLAYGGMAHAIDNLSFNSKMGAMLKNVMGDKAGDTGEMFNQLVRALEIRSGKMEAGDYQRQASKLFQAISVSGGTVNPENLLGFAQQAAIPLRGYSEDYLTRIVPSLIQEFGGERAGTASTALYNQFMGRSGGIGGKSVTDEWVRLGLVPKKGTGGNLSKTGWTPGTLKNNPLALSNPIEWIEKVLFPALRAKGMDTGNKDQMLLEAQKLFGRETGKRLASTLMDPAQLARIHADQTLYSRAMGPNAAFTQAMAKDPTMAMASAASSVKNLEITIGKAITPEVILALQNFAKGVNYLAAVIDKHPKLGVAIGSLMAGIVGFTGFKLAKSLVGFLGFGKVFSGVFKMLATAGVVGLRGPMLPLAMRIGSALRILLVGLAAGVGDALLGALAVGLEILAGPAGWVILAGTAVALVWGFRKEIARGWHIMADWFGTAFEYLKGRALAHDWSSIGTAIADALTFGLASRMPAMARGMENWASGLLHPKPHTMMSRIPPHRAMGGSVSRGSAYNINERGGEMFVPGRSGTMIPARATAALIAALSGGIPMGAAAHPAHMTFGDINVYEAHDAQATARAVRAEICRMANSQSALLND
jgi:hypothetical protein